MSKGISGVQYHKVVREDSGNAYYFKNDQYYILINSWQGFNLQTCYEGMLKSSCDYAINVRLNTYTFHKEYRDLESVFDIALRIPNTLYDLSLRQSNTSPELIDKEDKNEN